jgi:hypothetical protein
MGKLTCGNGNSLFYGEQAGIEDPMGDSTWELNCRRSLDSTFRDISIGIRPELRTSSVRFFALHWNAGASYLYAWHRLEFLDILQEASER